MRVKDPVPTTEAARDLLEEIDKLAAARAQRLEARKGQGRTEPTLNLLVSKVDRRSLRS